MKIWEKWLIGISGAAVLSGAISIGVTHSAYKNYNLVVAYARAENNEYFNGTNATFQSLLKSYLKYYNSLYANTSKNGKDALAGLQKTFRTQYPTFEDYYSSNSSYSESYARASYNLNYSLNYYSDCS